MYVLPVAAVLELCICIGLYAPKQIKYVLSDSWKKKIVLSSSNTVNNCLMFYKAFE